MTPEADAHHTFRHQRYIGPLSLHRVFINWLSRPLAVCLMPVMISTLFLALQEQQIGWLMKSGTSIAVLCAAGWTLLQMARTPAEVSFRNDRVLVRTFLEASLNPRPAKWHYVIDVKAVNQNTSSFVTAITYGHTAFEFKENDWEHLRLMTRLLEEAKKHYENKASTSTSG